MSGSGKPGSGRIYVKILQMKETYLTAASLEAFTAQALADYAGSNTRPARCTFEPAGSALLVLDLQRYFLEPDSHASVPSAAAIVPGIQALIRAYRNRRLPRVFTQHYNTPEDAGMMGVWWRDLVRQGSPGFELHPGLDLSDARVILKTQYDAFHQTELEAHLRRLEVRRVVICGVMTHLCCETTARSAFMRGFQVFFPVDGTATYNRSHHLASLANLAHGFACLTSMGELLRLLEAGDGT